MTDKVQSASEELVPEQVATAAPEPEVNAPEVTETPDEAKPEKTYTQAEIDAMIGKRLAREQRKWEREQAAKSADSQVLRAPVKDVPPADQFESPEAYADALAEQKAQELVRQRDVQREQAEIADAYEQRVEKALEKYDDFEQVAYNPKIRITDAMAETIRSSDSGPDIAYFLGSNPKEAERISRLSPLAQAKEIGGIEAKLATAPPVKRSSSAPAPITPVTARASGSPSYDTTDPRSVKSLSTSEWIEAERQRQTRKLQAQRN